MIILLWCMAECCFTICRIVSCTRDGQRCERTGLVDLFLQHSAEIDLPIPVRYMLIHVYVLVCVVKINDYILELVLFGMKRTGFT